MPKNRLARCLWIAAIRGFDPWVNKDRFIVSIPPVYIPQDPHIHVKYNYTLHLRPATFQLPLNFTSNSYFHPDLPLPVVHVSVSAFTLSHYLAPGILHETMAPWHLGGPILVSGSVFFGASVNWWSAHVCPLCKHPGPQRLSLSRTSWSPKPSLHLIKVTRIGKS